MKDLLALFLQVVLLLSDTQIKDESFAEDLSNLLNTYEVPNLLGSGDLAGIFENIRPRAKQAGMDSNRDQLYNFFVQEVSMISLSPGGGQGVLECPILTSAAAAADRSQAVHLMVYIIGSSEPAIFFSNLERTVQTVWLVMHNAPQSVQS